MSTPTLQSLEATLEQLTASHSSLHSLLASQQLDFTLYFQQFFFMINKLLSSNQDIMATQTLLGNIETSEKELQERIALMKSVKTE
jgi:hypothetical protein